MSDDGTDWKSFVNQCAIHHEEPDSRHLDFLPQHGRILEIGCGIGRWSRRFTEKNLLYIGIDLEPEALKVAKTKKLDLVRGDVRFLPFKDNSFEFVFSCDVLQHFRSTSTMPAILREAHRVLSAKGQLIVNEALSQNWSQQLAPLFTLVFSNIEYPLGTSKDSIGKSLMFAKENKI